MAPRKKPGPKHRKPANDPNNGSQNSFSADPAATSDANDVVDSPSPGLDQHLSSAELLKAKRKAFKEAPAPRKAEPAVQSKSGATLNAKDDSSVYARPRWRHATRVFGAIIVIMFNLTCIASNIDRYAHGKYLSFEKELITYILLVFCDLAILLPMILEVDSVQITDDSLIIKTIFWKRAIPWEQVKEFKKPRFLIYAVVHTRRCFYLINRRTIPRFDQLAQNISARLVSTRTV